MEGEWKNLHRILYREHLHYENLSNIPVSSLILANACPTSEGFFLT